MQDPWAAQIGRLSSFSPDNLRGEDILDMDWAILLWRRGFSHENPQVMLLFAFAAPHAGDMKAQGAGLSGVVSATQVQRYMAQSFLGMSLRADQMAALPPSFLVEDLLATVTKPYLLAKGASLACLGNLQMD